MKRSCLRLSQLSLILLAILLLVGCAGSSISPGFLIPNSNLGYEQADSGAPGSSLPGAAYAWPITLPVDAAQPWEELDTQGRVIPRAAAQPATKAGAMINAQSIVAAGVEWHAASAAGVAENFDAARLTCGNAGSRAASWAVYRLVLGGEQPGVVACDVNMRAMSNDAPSSYWLAIANYGRGSWEWHGPFTEHHARVSTARSVAEGADYLSDAGNLFVCIVAYNGAEIDVVAVAANPLSDGGPAVPSQPQNLAALGVPGGLRVSWYDVDASDLAGYRLLTSDAPFASPDDPDVRECFVASGGARFLPGKPITTWVGVTAVDIAGNESPLSNIVSAAPLDGELPPIIVTASRPSGLINMYIELSAAGADTYDWDLDGDGLFEVTGDAGGTQSVDTSAAGIIRAAVLGASAGGGMAGGGVSVLLGTNSRPAASARANPQFGEAPLSVTFSGQAADFEDSLMDLTFAWDFNGDGLYEQNTNTLSPPVQQYDTPGAFNAKLRVTDSVGAWDVDTVTIVALDLVNQAPSVSLSVDNTIGIAPLKVEFEAVATEPDGEPLLYFWDFEGDGYYEFQSPGPVCSHVYLETCAVMAIVKVIDPHGAAATSWQIIMVNGLPDTKLTVDPAEGSKGLTVYCDASASTDPDWIDNYEWDLDGDGVFNETGTEADAEGVSSVVAVYPEPGKYTVTVRVTDSYNAMPASSMASADVLIHGWVDVTIDSVGGENSSVPICIVDGNPAIAYWDFDNRDLRYAWSSTATGDNAGDWTRITVDSADHVGAYASLAIVAGSPAISYEDETNYNLKYARANTSTGASAVDWTQIVTVDNSADEIGRYTSLAVVNGNPAISYHDQTATALKYARSTTITGGSASDWTQIVTVDTLADVGRYNSLCVVDGNPAISYCDSGNTALKYARSSTATGAAPADWSTILTIDNSGTIGYYTSLAVVSGCPAISYIDIGSTCVKYARAITPSGGNVADWQQIVLVDSLTNAPSYTSLAVIHGQPAIVYKENTSNDLYYTRSATNTGGGATDWTDMQIIGDSERDVFLAEVAGKPAITYYVWTTEYEVHYAICY